jgi:dephospho-CoA kinase
MLFVELAPCARVYAGPAAAVARTAAGATKRVIVFVGLPGSGKSTAADRLANRLGTRRRSTGDVIRNTIAARGLEYNAINDRAVAEEFARRPGEIGRGAAAQVAADPSPVQVVEGFRTVADLDSFLAGVPQAVVVSVEVGTDRRHARQLARGRAGEDNVAYLKDRDRSELRRGQRDVMRKADLRIRPRGDDLEALDRSLVRVVEAAEARARATPPPAAAPP